MVHLIRNNSPYTVIILFIFTLVIKLQALSHPVVPVILPGHFFYGFVVHLLDYVLSGSAFAYTMLAVVMLFGQALYLNNIIIRQRMFAKPMYNVAFMYLVLTSLSPYFSYFSELLLVNWVMIAALKILLGLHQTPTPRKNLFNAGFLISVAALFHFPVVIYILLLMMAVSMLRSFNPGEWIVGILGFITPIYFLAGVLFLCDRLALMAEWPRWHFWFPTTDMANPVYMFGVLTGIVILLLCGLYMLQAHMGKTSVFTRRKWAFLTAYIFLSVAVALSTERTISGAWLAAMPSLSLITALPLYMEKNKRFSNFIFYFSLIFLIFCQLAINI